MDTYSHRYSITAADMDTRYRMTPNAVLLYYQDCWARFMSCLHLAAFDIVKHNLLWIITEFNAYFEPETALWSDDIEVTVWNSQVSALRCYAEYRIRRTDGTEVAHGYGCWSLIEVSSHHLAPTTALPHPVPALPQMAAESHRKRRFKDKGTVLQTYEHRVNPSIIAHTCLSLCDPPKRRSWISTLFVVCQFFGNTSLSLATRFNVN